MYRKKVMTTGLAILAIVMAISVITASGGGSSGLVTSAFAVKKGDSKTGTSRSSSSSSSSSSNSKSSSSTSTSGTSTGSKSKFIKCVTAISGSSPSKAEVDKCWDQVFGGGSGLTLGGSFGGGGSTLGSGGTSSRSSSSGSSGHGGTTGSGSST
jgi:hypothetical protein